MGRAALGRGSRQCDVLARGGVVARGPRGVGQARALFDEPGAFAQNLRTMVDIDIRPVLASVRAPTLVLHRRGDPIVPVGQGRYLADAVPDAHLVELDGEDHVPWLGDRGAVLDEVEAFVTGARPQPETERVLATVMFTDIVGSTTTAVRMGDRGWAALLEQHDMLAGEVVRAHRGRVVDSTGDGLMATFDGPARAVRAGEELCGRVRTLDLEIRVGCAHR